LKTAENFWGADTDIQQNYIDPRLTVVFSKKFNVPIEKFFSKTLREKFEWAIKSVDEDWEF
jgi:DNA topoisomerase I